MAGADKRVGEWKDERALDLTSIIPSLLGRPKPAQKRVFTVSGSYVVVLIVVTVLGGVVFCATLIYILFKHYSTRYLLPWAQGGTLAGNWDSTAGPALRGGGGARVKRHKPGSGLSGIIWADR